MVISNSSWTHSEVKTEIEVTIVDMLYKLHNLHSEFTSYKCIRHFAIFTCIVTCMMKWTWKESSLFLTAKLSSMTWNWSHLNLCCHSMDQRSCRHLKTRPNYTVDFFYFTVSEVWKHANYSFALCRFHYQFRTQVCVSKMPDTHNAILLITSLAFISLSSPLPLRKVLLLKIYLFILIGTTTSQHCGGPCHTSTQVSCGCTCCPPHILNPPSTSLPISLGCSRAPASSTLLHASNLHGHLFYIW